MLLPLLLLKVIRTENAITYEEGEILFNNLAEAIKSKNYVEIDFSGITILTAAFLSSSFGELYTHFESDEINNYIKVKNLREDHNCLLEYVIMRTKEFKSNPKIFDEVINNTIYGD